MKRRDLEHIVRAAADIADDDEIIVIGSQAILGEHPDAPSALCVSDEADVYPKNKPEHWNVIDGAIGEGSTFHDTFGYYAQGVEEGTATLPAGWKDRLVLVSNAGTRLAKAWCLETHDLVLSKYVAAREKDHRFNRAAIEAGYVDKAVLHARLATMPIDEAARGRVAKRIEHDFAT
ncbi:MAG TPA: DUF6036 family nucleotidyltransferase [Polyangiaceae bacterium]|nr:DUF6036 family nucleotidyltransferase [Polyangiaceae bacterium]